MKNQKTTSITPEGKQVLLRDTGKTLKFKTGVKAGGIKGEGS